MDIKTCNTFDYALNDLTNLLGLESISKETSDCFVNWNDDKRSTLYNLILSLCLGREVFDKFIFKNNIIQDYLQPNIKIDNLQNDDISQCTYTESLNLYIYMVLESLGYTRLSKITLDDNQDQRELFIAIAFLISKENWFKKVDSNSNEISNIKDNIIENSTKYFDFSDIRDSDLKSIIDYDWNQNSIDNKYKHEHLVEKTNKENDQNILEYLLNHNKINSNNDDEYINSFLDKKNIFEEHLLKIASDISAKSTLLSKRKTVRSYDSELLRLIIGRSEYEIDFLKYMDDIYSNVTDLVEDNFHMDNFKDEFWFGVDDLKEWHDIIKDIVKLSNVIVQLQYKIRYLSKCIQSNDNERLRYFGKVIEEFKNYESTNVPKGVKNIMSEKNKIPSPVEFLLISDEELFKRHLCIMGIINRSLDNEIRRSEFWIRALHTINQINCESKNDDDDSCITSKLVNYKSLLKIHFKPCEIKYNVHVLKSFLVEGIPTNNFQNNIIGVNYPNHSDFIDFLRNVNVKFANFQAGQVADKKGRKTTFSVFIRNEIDNAINEGIITEDKMAKVQSKLADLHFHLELTRNILHLVNQVDITRTRMSFPLMRKWIFGYEKFDILNEQSEDGDNKSILKIINDSMREDYDILESKNFKLVDSMVKNSVKFEEPEKVSKLYNNSISDIVNFDYYFELCKKDFELVPHVDVDCTGLVNEIQKLASNSSKLTDMNQRKAQGNIKSILNLIKDKTEFHLI